MITQAYIETLIDVAIAAQIHALSYTGNFPVAMQVRDDANAARRELSDTIRIALRQQYVEGKMDALNSIG